MIREQLGNVVGEMLSPLAAIVSHARQARTFHAKGRTFSARVGAILGSPFDELASRLEGPALARFSGALWRGEVEKFDVLGVALRFRTTDTPGTEAAPQDQDLLLATIVSPFTMPVSPLTTDAHDFFDNKYWAVSPFEAAGIGAVKFRLIPQLGKRDHEAPRMEALEAEVAAGKALWILEARRTYALRWSPLARITLTADAHLDEEALRFSPFQNGRGIKPRGFIHALRRAVYPASQDARPH